nr:MAG TPA: hypothetical protein [Caudoviricetes sp.]
MPLLVMPKNIPMIILISVEPSSLMALFYLVAWLIPLSSNILDN